MIVNFPGYGPFFENQNTVYCKDTAVSDQSGKRHEVKSIILPTRYTEANKDKVVNYIAGKIRSAQGASKLVLPEHIRKAKSPLEQMILELPEKIRVDIINGNKEALKFFKQFSPAPHHQENYARTRYGFILSQALEDYQQKKVIMDYKWFHHIFPQLANFGIGRELFHVGLLVEKDSLPPEADMQAILNHVPPCNTRSMVIEGHYSGDDARDVATTLYLGLNSPEAIKSLPDVSEDILENLALMTLGNIFEALHKANNNNILRNARENPMDLPQQQKNSR